MLEPVGSMRTEFLLEAKGLAVNLGGKPVLSGVDLALRKGTVAGVLGPSGAGKTTLVRALCGLLPLAGGSLFFQGVGSMGTSREEWSRARRVVQPLFQDPGTALNPRKTVARHLEDAYLIKGEEPERSLLERAALKAGFPPELLDRFPRELSGGERQRAALARVLAMDPQVLLLDEPFSALDPPLREEMGDLVLDLARKEGKALLLVTHDLGEVLGVAEEMGILGWGRFLEWGPLREVYSHPLHPWTAALVEAFRKPGSPPPSWTLLPPKPKGCPFHGGCPGATRSCGERTPALAEWEPGRKAACFHPLEG